MPELPEVEALAEFLRQRLIGRVVARVDVASISVLKTYDPPVTGLQGLTITGVSRHGKFIDLDVDGLHLITHLARAGWLRWREQLSTALLKPGKGPISFRVHLDDGSGFDLTEAGTQKSLAVYIVRDPQDVPGITRLGPDPMSESFDVAALRKILAGPSANTVEGLVARSVRHRGHRQRVQRRDLECREVVAVQTRGQLGRRGDRAPARGDHQHAERCPRPVVGTTGVRTEG